ncbi:MAG: membrane protein insertion efficiency factor YidD [Polynucleobacter sp.]|nr:membrane protein insertion efficiency factor YidD [Polynucleobacter sp.]
MVSGDFVMRIENRPLYYLVRIYQYFISPAMGHHCKFFPSCSQYACDCLKEHGPIKSIQKISWRIIRCNPWSRGGYDPVAIQTPESNQH